MDEQVGDEIVITPETVSAGLRAFEIVSLDEYGQIWPATAREGIEAALRAALQEPSASGPPKTIGGG